MRLLCKGTYLLSKQKKYVDNVCRKKKINLFKYPLEIQYLVKVFNIFLRKYAYIFSLNYHLSNKKILKYFITISYNKIPQICKTHFYENIRKKQSVAV